MQYLLHLGIVSLSSKAPIFFDCLGMAAYGDNCGGAVSIFVGGGTMDQGVAPCWPGQ